MKSSIHIPVLLNKAIESLAIQESDRVFDGTLGSGGHASAIMELLSERGAFIGSDLDLESIERAKDKIESKNPKCQVNIFHGSFENIKEYIQEVGIENIDKALLDLGWSQDQFESSGRGFSFAKDEVLSMAYNPSSVKFDAREILNDWQEESIADIIYGYGEERFARKIAKAIVEYRKDSEIKTSAQLAEIVEKALPKRFVKFGRHPATKTFQALRIAVNDELEVLKKSLDNIHDVLSSGGRLAVITFHSLEDRIVKNKFRDWKKEGRGVLVNKKVILPDKEELQVNKRARSAKLRVYEKK